MAASTIGTFYGLLNRDKFNNVINDCCKATKIGEQKLVNKKLNLSKCFDIYFTFKYYYTESANGNLCLFSCRTSQVNTQNLSLFILSGYLSIDIGYKDTTKGRYTTNFKIEKDKYYSFKIEVRDNNFSVINVLTNEKQDFKITSEINYNQLPSYYSICGSLDTKDDILQITANRMFGIVKIKIKNYYPIYRTDWVKCTGDSTKGNVTTKIFADNNTIYPPINSDYLNNAKKIKYSFTVDFTNVNNITKLSSFALQFGGAWEYLPKDIDRVKLSPILNGVVTYSDELIITRNDSGDKFNGTFEARLDNVGGYLLIKINYIELI